MTSPNFDRGLQQLLLLKLAERYPVTVTPESIGFSNDDPALVANLAYLDEHDLVSMNLVQPLDGSHAIAPSAKITARGLDFLAEDGGLGAILNVVTVRFDATTLKALIDAKIEASPLPQEEKSRLRQLLAKAGEESLKKAATLLIEQAVKHAPDALRALEAILA